MVTERELEALFARGLHPSTGDQLGRAWRTDGVTGFDLTFSAPKSVSALWALGDSSTVALATSQIFSSVAGSMMSKRAPSDDFFHLPPIQRSVGTPASRLS